MGGAVETSTPSQNTPSPKTASNDPFDHELRYLLSHGETRRFLNAVAARAAIEIYDRERPISYTRTTYLDTDDLTYFRSGPGQPARRLRVREYAVATTPKDAPMLSGVAFVELKEHDGPARRKIRLAASPAEIAQLLANRKAGPSSNMTAGQAELARELARPTMAPRLATWYRRLCLTAEARRAGSHQGDREVRIQDREDRGRDPDSPRHHEEEGRKKGKKGVGFPSAPVKNFDAVDFSISVEVSPL